MKKSLTSFILVFLSTFLSGILSYLYHPIMVRYLSLEEFAEFQSLIWIINILWVITAALSLFVIKEYAKDLENKNSFVLSRIFFKYCFFLWIMSFIIYLLFLPFISSFLKIDNYFIIAFTWLNVFLYFFWMYMWPFLQAKLQFKTISILSVFNTFSRLIIWFTLVFFWFKLFWAVWWFVFSQIIAIVITYFLIRKQLVNPGNNFNIKESEKQIKLDFLKQKRQIVHFLFSAIILALFMNLDILFAKHFFDSETAWIYAWISVIAKFLVFVWTSIETVYFPILTSQDKLDKKKFSLLSSLYFLMTVWAIWFFYLFWEKILHLFKPWFEEYLNLLYLIIIYCWILSLLNFLVKILIAFEKYFINYIILAVTGIFIWILYLFVDNSVYNLINIFNLMIFVSLFAWFVYFFMIKDEK